MCVFLVFIILMDGSVVFMQKERHIMAAAASLVFFSSCIGIRSGRVYNSACQRHQAGLLAPPDRTGKAIYVKCWELLLVRI